jgi:hypothetical protein
VSPAERLAARVEAERVAAGLDPRISDPAVLAKIARMVSGRHQVATGGRS